MKCKYCKTGAHIRRYRVEVEPGVWQEMYECRNCGLRWKVKGAKYRESLVLKREKVK